MQQAATKPGYKKISTSPKQFDIQKDAKIQRKTHYGCPLQLVPSWWGFLLFKDFISTAKLYFHIGFKVLLSIIFTNKFSLIYS